MADLSGLDTENSKKINGPAPQEAAAADSISESKAPSWRTFLAVHPAADRIPEAGQDEKHALAADLAQHGQRQPIILVQVGTRPKQVLDGRTRLDLLSAAGVEVVDVNGKVLVHHRTIQVANDTEAEHLSLSLNVHRRHLNAEQWQDLLIKHIERTPEKSDRQLGKEIGVDHKTISRARAKGEDVGRIPHVSARTDTRGRKQPSRKTRKMVAKPQPATDKPKTGDVETATSIDTKRRAQLSSQPCADIGANSASETAHLQAQIDAPGSGVTMEDL